CDFKIKEEHTGHENYPRVRLRVRYRVERSKKLGTLYSLSVRRVDIELVPGIEQESSDLMHRRCSWNKAHKQIKKFYVSRAGLQSTVPLLSLSRWRLQPKNEVYFTRRIVLRANNIRDLIKTLLSVLSGIAHDKLRLTHGRTQVLNFDTLIDDQCYSEMYGVKHCAVVSVYGSVAGVDVRYTICKRKPGENAHLFNTVVYFMGLNIRDFSEHVKFLRGDFCSHMDSYVFTTETWKAVTCRHELLEDTRRLHGYNKGEGDFDDLLSVVPPSALAVNHVPEAVHHGRGGGAYLALTVRNYLCGQCSYVNV
ncbi:hypothetical protein, partial [Candidatus Anaplasma sp. TIGMIC]|uniref:hypothetical protein n=1 Tax=Candidatus Anaplasma sp. TIGMIC TaxID=3020713 RepID=UPI00232AEACE